MNKSAPRDSPIIFCRATRGTVAVRDTRHTTSANSRSNHPVQITTTSCTGKSSIKDTASKWEACLKDLQSSKLTAEGIRLRGRASDAAGSNLTIARNITKRWTGHHHGDWIPAPARGETFFSPTGLVVKTKHESFCFYLADKLRHCKVLFMHFAAFQSVR